jgi:hypothetical protein
VPLATWATALGTTWPEHTVGPDRPQDNRPASFAKYEGPGGANRTAMTRHSLRSCPTASPGSAGYSRATAIHC